MLLTWYQSMVLLSAHFQLHSDVTLDWHFFLFPFWFAEIGVFVWDVNSSKKIGDFYNFSWKSTLLMLCWWNLTVINIFLLRSSVVLGFFDFAHNTGNILPTYNFTTYFSPCMRKFCDLHIVCVEVVVRLKSDLVSDVCFFCDCVNSLSVLPWVVFLIT